MKSSVCTSDGTRTREEGGEEREGVKEKRMWPTVKDDWRGVELRLIIDPAVSSRPRQKWRFFLSFYPSFPPQPPPPLPPPPPRPPSHNRIFTRRAARVRFAFLTLLSTVFFLFFARLFVVSSLANVSASGTCCVDFLPLPARTSALLPSVCVSVRVCVRARPSAFVLVCACTCLPSRQGSWMFMET